jgi:hypothetical protein
MVSIEACRSAKSWGGTISDDYEQRDENDVLIAILTLLRVPAVGAGDRARRHYTYRAGNSVEWGEIPDGDGRGDADVVNDVFFTRGKPRCAFRRKV